MYRHQWLRLDGARPLGLCCVQWAGGGKEQEDINFFHNSHSRSVLFQVSLGTGWVRLLMGRRKDGGGMGRPIFYPYTNRNVVSNKSLFIALLLQVSLSCSVVNSCLTLCSWTAAHQAPLPSFIIFQTLLKFMSIESVMLSNHLILCCPLFLWPSIFPSMRVFLNELTLCIRWPKYSSFRFSVTSSPSSEYSGLISFRMDWFDLLAV